MDVTTLIILAIVSAVAAYLIAQSRGHGDPVMWGLAGFLLGPIGLLLAVVFAKRPNT